MTGTEILMTGVDTLATGMQYATQGASTTMIIIYAVIAILVLIGGSQIYLQMENKKAKAWLEKNPSASKVYIKTLNLLIYTQELTVSAIDGERPVMFYEMLGLKKWFYLVPGEHVITSSFSSTRPGIFHKTVTTTYDPSENKVEVKQGKEYDYSFSTSKEVYTFKVRK